MMLPDIVRRAIGLPTATSPVGFRVHPNRSLVKLNRRDHFRVRDAFEGVVIMGGTGSGKSSGSGEALAMSYLRAGWGGMVMCAKPDEAARWQAYARKAGRAAHVIHFHPESQWNFNFADYEAHRPDGAGGDTFNLVNLFDQIVEFTELSEGKGGNGDNPFWPRARREMLANVVEPLFAATGTLRIDDIIRFIGSAPRTRQDAFNDEWKVSSFMYQILCQAMREPKGRAVPEHAMRASANYWFSTFAELDPRTRSNIVATLTSTLAPFLRGMLRERFCTSTNFIPETTHEGAIIIVDFPVKLWGDAGVVAANIMKYQWQRATERRVITKNSRPVFLWADECQFFLTDYDAEFQSTARSARAATVYITQNLPTFQSRLKGSDPRATAESLLGNFQTKIFHSNTDIATNQFATDMIGKGLQPRRSGNWSQNSGRQSSENWGQNWGEQSGVSSGESWGSNWGSQIGESQGRNWGTNSSFGSSSGNGSSSSSSSFGSSSGGSSGTSRSWSRGGSYGVNSGTSHSVSSGGNYSNGVSASHGTSAGGGWSEQMDYVVQPRVFAAELRKGGKADRKLVDGVMVQGGRQFARTGAHWLPCTFKQ
jgi:TraM recognition site of TraD and TraG